MTAWEHAALILGAVLAIVVGGVDLEWGHRLAAGVDSAFILGGLAALGVKGTGGITGGK